MSGLSLGPKPPSSAEIVAYRDDLKRKLAEIWTEVIGANTRPVGSDDDFFALGGDSLLAADLMVQLSQTLGEPIPLETLLSAPTISRMAANLAARRAEKSNASRRAGTGPADPHAMVVALRGVGSKTPMFLLPGSGGHVLGFYELVRLSDPDRPFFGLQFPDPAPGRMIPPTVEEMAARFLPEILAVEPAGPYLLGGYSFGGLVAFELARQLEAKGRKVGLVAMIDAWGRDYPRKVSMPLRVLDHFRAIARCPSGTRVAYVRERVAKRLSRQAEPRGAALSKPFENINRLARLNYRPEPYSGRLVVFRAAERPDWPGMRFDDPELGWGPFALGGVAVRTVAGNHISLLHSPQVASLAKALREVLG